MDDMREKLAELIRKANTAMWGKTISDRQTESRFIADYLIENGVILPPCKVGEVVYDICTIFDESTLKSKTIIKPKKKHKRQLMKGAE